MLSTVDLVVKWGSGSLEGWGNRGEKMGTHLTKAASEMHGVNTLLSKDVL